MTWILTEDWKDTIKTLTNFHNTVHLYRTSLLAVEVYTAWEAKTTKQKRKISWHGENLRLDLNAPIKVTWRVLIKCLNCSGFKQKAFNEGKTICLHIKRLHVHDSISLGQKSF